MTATSLSAPRSLLFANVACMASMIFWAAGLPAADVLIGKVPPLILTAARTGVAALVLVPIWLLIEGSDVMRAAHWRRGLLIGGITIGFGALLLVIAQKMTDPVTIAIVAAASPLIGMALEIALDGRRVTVPLVVGLGLSLVGGVLALGPSLGEVGFGLGTLLCLISVAVFTLGSRLSVTAFPALSPLGRTSLTLTGAAVMTGIAALAHTAAGGPQPEWTALGWPDLVALLIFGVGGMAISQVLWIMSVGRLGIGLASLHINATPFYVMVILFATGAAWNWAHALAAVIVAVGVLVAQGLIPLRRAVP